MPRRNVPTLAAAALLELLDATAIVCWDILIQREGFAADERIAHRLLSQRAAQLHVVLAMLALLAPGTDAEEQAVRLPSPWAAAH